MEDSGLEDLLEAKLNMSTRKPLDPSDPHELLALCANLYDKSASAIQIKVNNYVSQVHVSH